MAELRKKLGLDIGYGDVKGVFKDEDVLEFFKFPTAVKFAPPDNEGLDRFTSTREYRYNGSKYLVGEAAKTGAFSVRSFDFMKQFTPLLAFKAIEIVREKGMDVPDQLSLGIPLSYYNNAHVDEMNSAMRRIEVNGEYLELATKFYPQGFGTLADYRLDADGCVIEDTDKNIVIIDIGFNTIDMVAVEKGKVTREDSDTLYGQGVSKMALEVLARLRTTEDLYYLSEVTANDILLSGKYRVYGQEKDLSGFKKTVIAEYTKWLFIEMESKMAGRLQDADKVILSGGGAHYIKDYIPQKYSDMVFIPHNPEYSNARGFLKLIEGTGNNV